MVVLIGLTGSIPARFVACFSLAFECPEWFHPGDCRHRDGRHRRLHRDHGHRLQVQNAVALFVEDLLKMSKTLQFSVVCSSSNLDQPGSMLDECFHGRVDLTWL